MTELQVEEAIRQRWAEGWAAYHPSDVSHPSFAPYTFANETFSHEQLGALGAWARVTVRWTAAEQTTQGQADARKWEARGIVFVQLFAPPDTGVATLARMAYEARKVLQGRRIEELNIFEGETREDIERPDFTMRPVVFRFAAESSDAD